MTKLAFDGLIFGTAGVPHSAAENSTLSGLKRIKELGLDGLEIEFVHGVHLRNETAALIRRSADKLGLFLSVHAPYYINLNSEDLGKRLQSQERLLRSSRMAAACGAESVVFHAGYYGLSSPEKAYQTIKSELLTISSILRQERTQVVLRMETMGKKSQFGSLDEVLQLCREVENLEPCLDFSHIYAREGRINAYDDFLKVLGKVARKLGQAALKRLHIHISGVHFNESGELKHLNLQEADFKYDEWLEALSSIRVKGMVISESPNLEEDALSLKKYYQTAMKAQNHGHYDSKIK